MATHPSHPAQEPDEEERDPLDGTLDAFVAFTGHPLRETQRVALKAMIVDLFQTTAETQAASLQQVDAVRLADVLYEAIEDADPVEIVDILSRASLEGEALDTWARRKDSERTR